VSFSGTAPVKVRKAGGILDTAGMALSLQWGRTREGAEGGAR